MPCKEGTICGENCPNYQRLDKQVLKQTTSEEIDVLSNMFKLFSDPTRLRIICTILNDELRVTDICELLEMNRTTVSHQLKLLRDSRLVKYRKEGTEVYYSLKDTHVEQMIRQAMDHVSEK